MLRIKQPTAKNMGVYYTPCKLEMPFRGREKKAGGGGGTRRALLLGLREKGVQAPSSRGCLYSLQSKNRLSFSAPFLATSGYRYILCILVTSPFGLSQCFYIRVEKHYVPYLTHLGSHGIPHFIVRPQFSFVEKAYSTTYYTQPLPLLCVASFVFPSLLFFASYNIPPADDVRRSLLQFTRLVDDVPTSRAPASTISRGAHFRLLPCAVEGQIAASSAAITTTPPPPLASVVNLRGWYGKGAKGGSWSLSIVSVVSCTAIDVRFVYSSPP